MGRGDDRSQDTPGQGKISHAQLGCCPCLPVAGGGGDLLKGLLLLYVLEGTFDVVLGDLEQAAGEGTWLHVPAGTIHTTRCTSDVGHLLSVYTPGGSEEFFRQIGAIDQTDVSAVLALADQHGMTVAGPDPA